MQTESLRDLTPCEDRKMPLHSADSKASSKAGPIRMSGVVLLDRTEAAEFCEFLAEAERALAPQHLSGLSAWAASLFEVVEGRLFA